MKNWASIGTVICILGLVVLFVQAGEAGHNTYTPPEIIDTGAARLSVPRAWNRFGGLGVSDDRIVFVPL